MSLPISTSPEVMFKELNLRTLDLAGVLKPLLRSPEDESRFDDLMYVLRRGFAVEILRSVPCVAVAGTQGAGKSTLVRTLYDLPDDCLWTNPGLGENLPVFIVEKAGITHPVKLMHEVKFGTRAFKVVEELNDSDWRDAMRNELEGRHPLWLELQVPIRYTQDGGRGVVLLPGYKTQGQDKSSWGSDWDQVLLRQAMVASSAAIVVTDRARLANKAEDLIIEDIKAHVTSPIIAIVREDAASESGKAELRTTAAKAFAVNEDDVFFTRRDTADPWAGQLMDYVKDVSSEHIARRHQFAQIEGLLGDLQRLERWAINLFNAADQDFSAEQLGWKRLTNNYLESVARARRSFERHVGSTLKAHAEEASDRCVDMYDDEYGGSIWKKGWDKLFGPSEYEKDRRRSKIIEKAWNANALQGKILGILSQDVLPEPTHASEPHPAGEHLRSSAEIVLARPRVLLDDTEISRLQEVAEAITNNRLPDDPRALTSTVKKMPVVLLDLILTSTDVDLHRPGCEIVDRSPESLNQSLSGFISEHRELMRTMFGLAMVDFAVDGHFDGIASAVAMKAALVKVGLTSAAASAVVGVAAAGALLALAQQASRHMDRKNIEDARSAIALVSDETYRGLMEDFDSIMEFGQHRLQEFISKATQYDEKLDQHLSASMRLSEVEILRSSLQRLTASSAMAITA